MIAHSRCYQCGICVASCQLGSLIEYSPRNLILDSLLEIPTPQLWDCLTCGACTNNCPQGVDFTQLVIDYRARNPDPQRISHHGIFSLIHELMAIHPNPVPLDFKGELDPDSKIGYFPGCLGFLDLLLPELGMDFGAIARSCIQLLNEVGIVPSLAPLKCCGHDDLYQGNLDTFSKLREHNLRVLKNYHRLILSCPECYMTLIKHYPQSSTQILHFSQVLLESGDLEFRCSNSVVTLHDSCRMGRYMGVYQPPRILISRIAQLREMVHSKQNSICCGVHAWLNCNDLAKALRCMILQEASDTNASVLITTCPKCLAHLGCLKYEFQQYDPERYRFGIQDLAVFLAQHL